MNFKLYFKYIFFHTNQVFLKQLIRNDKNTTILSSTNQLYYIALHLKLSSIFYSTQLVDLFAYEIPTNFNNPQTNRLTNNITLSLNNNSILVYNFHSILYQQRFFIFILNLPKQNINKNSIQWSSCNSISELFLNANWLERELAELHGIFFLGKKDLRNLLLQYGDTTSPMLKSYPSVGTREIFYDSVSDLLIQNPVSLQF
jgi:NADH:ubiquinone oxidoreductase subunit C